MQETDTASDVEVRSEVSGTGSELFEEVGVGEVLEVPPDEAESRDAKIRARDIQWHVMRRADWQVNTVIPNYTPPRWWECDVFVVTKSGYFNEYEIKVSRSDFKKDADKERQRRRNGLWQTEGKHDLLAASDERAPNRFWFCVPEGLVKVQEVPDWAGLLEFKGVMRETKRAPWLHRKRYAHLGSAHENAYHRYHRARCTTEAVESERDRLAIEALEIRIEIETLKGNEAVANVIRNLLERRREAK